MKKILVVHNRYKLLGGEDVAVDNEIEILKKYFEVKTLIFDNNKTDIFSIITTFLLNKNPRSIKLLKKQLQTFKPDVVYIHNTWFTASVGIFNTLSKSGVKTLIKLHNFRYDCTRSYLTSKNCIGTETCSKCGNAKNSSIFNKYFSESLIKSIFVIRYGKRYFKALKNPNVKILVLTSFHKNYLKNLGFTVNNIYVLPNSFSSEIINKKNNENNDLVYAGRISKEKGVEELVEAFIKSKSSSLNLLLIGDGPLKQNLENRYSSHANIKFLGQKSNFETREIIANSKAVVTATKLFEGQPTLLCEASFMGVPAIFPKFGGIHEFFPENTDLSFKQFDYLDLQEKIKLLNINSFEKEGIKNKNFFTDRFNEKIIIKKFMDILND